MNGETEWGGSGGEREIAGEKIKERGRGTAAVSAKSRSIEISAGIA